MSIKQHTKRGEHKGKHWHHIVPKHSGGNDSISNLVLLTPLEHANAHLDLYQKYGNQGDAWAYNRLMRQIGCNRKSLYVAPNKGKTFSDSVNKKKGRHGTENAMSRPDVIAKHREAMSKLVGSDAVKNFSEKNKASKSITINGKTFGCISDAAKHYLVDRCTVRSWLAGTKPQPRFAIFDVRYVIKDGHELQLD